MPYKIFKFVTPNANYQRERFTFKCLKFDLEIDLSRLIIIIIIIGNVWSVAMLQLVFQANLVGFECFCCVKKFFCPLNLHTYRPCE